MASYRMSGIHALEELMEHASEDVVQRSFLTEFGGADPEVRQAFFLAASADHSTRVINLLTDLIPCREAQNRPESPSFIRDYQGYPQQYRESGQAEADWLSMKFCQEYDIREGIRRAVAHTERSIERAQREHWNADIVESEVNFTKWSLEYFTGYLKAFERIQPGDISSGGQEK
jgi:hypothetical protein